VSQSTIQAMALRLLAAHPFVDADPTELVSILATCRTVRIAPGRALCHEGEPGLELFFLLSGRIAVSKQDHAGQTTALGTVSAPSLLGQLAVIDRSRRTATCTADEESAVAAMDQATFGRLMRDTGPPGITLRRLLLSSLTRQLVEGNGRLRNLMDQVATGAGNGHDPEALSGELLRTSGVLNGWSDVQVP